jgi:hypothetical protein
MNPYLKKYNLFPVLIFTLFMQVSCLDNELTEVVETLEVQTVMPEGFKQGIEFENQTVTLKSNRYSYTATTDAEGLAIFQNIIPDIYSISTSLEIEGNDYVLMADTVVESRNVVLSGSKTKTQLFESQTIILNLELAVKQSLIISKVYASGTKDNNNKNYSSDQYIELFNNSDEVEYIDSTLYFGLVEAESVIAYPARNNPGFVYARQIFRFVNNADSIAVNPGTSVLIVNSAINHLEFSPASVNLRSADFEAKSPNYSNNSDVRELKLIYSAFASLIYMNLVRGGDNGVFLFRTHERVSQFPIFYIPGRETGNRYMQIPANLIFDGMESLKNNVNTGPNINNKRLHNFIDAGFGFINAISGYTNESVERRVDLTKSNANRYYLIDTNNSTNDLKTVTDPTPRKYDKPLLLN